MPGVRAGELPDAARAVAERAHSTGDGWGAEWLAIAQRLGEKHVQLRCDEASQALLQSEIPNLKSEIRPATEQDWFTEYNDYILNVRVVDDAGRLPSRRTRR